MAKLSVLFLAVLVALSARCLAHSLDDPELELREGVEDTGLEDDVERRSAYAQAQASASAVAGVQNQPVPYQRQLVNCFVCADCPQLQANTTTKSCPGSNDRSKHNKCIVYSEKYQHMKKPWYIRGCASERGSCQDIRKAHEQHGQIVKLLSCTECEGDRCNTNGVSRSIPNLVTSFVVLVLTPIVGKYALS